MKPREQRKTQGRSVRLHGTNICQFDPELIATTCNGVTQSIHSSTFTVGQFNHAGIFMKALNLCSDSVNKAWVKWK